MKVSELLAFVLVVLSDVVVVLVVVVHLCNVLLLFEVQRAQVVGTLVGRTCAAIHRTALAATVSPANTVRNGDSCAAKEGAECTAAMGPAHTFGFSAIGAVWDLAFDRATVAPAATCMFGSTCATFNHAVLAAFFDDRAICERYSSLA